MSRFWRFIFFLAWIPAASLAAAAQKKSAGQGSRPMIVPYEDATGLLIIPVTVEGKPCHFLFDTGSFTALSPDLAKQLKLKREGKVNFLDANNIKGSAAFQDLNEISVSTLRFYNKKVAVFPSPLFKCLNIDGVLGNDLLADYVLYIDPKKNLRRKKLRLLM
ncbi:MAG: clan AA aspartic protease [Niabella sp.]|nr:clan AA aspartic protease [Niabella sp.]